MVLGRVMEGVGYPHERKDPPISHQYPDSTIKYPQVYLPMTHLR